MELHYHPLSSYCHKALIALYESDLDFTPISVDLGAAEERAALTRLNPFGQFPVLIDGGRAVAESTIIIEYLERRGGPRLIPADAEAALEVRAMDRLFDLRVHDRMQAITDQWLRGRDTMDRWAVDRARARLTVAYDALEDRLAGRTWAAGETFSMADCAAAPALFYAERQQPFREGRPVLSAYFDRLLARPSYRRALAEAEPFMAWVPTDPDGVA